MSFDEIKYEKKKTKPVVFPAEQSVFYEIKFYKINICWIWSIKKNHNLWISLEPRALHSNTNP